MRTRILPLVLGCALSGCVQRPGPRPVPVENDRSIVFPQFFEQTAAELDPQGVPFELEGVVLQAIMLAANDFLPPSAKERPCWDRQEAHRYRSFAKATSSLSGSTKIPHSAEGATSRWTRARSTPSAQMAGSCGVS